ncbi:MAG: MATE family efflux transporter, partial [candidate division KSB1 bacterium]|nr:MATE family efflux transporter [candidate division KSB1 bacterium]
LGQLRLFLRFGLPLIPAGLALTTLALIDRFFLVRYTDLTQLGLYSIGNQVANSVLLLVSGFQLAWGPFAFSVAKTGKSEGLYVKTLHYYLIVLGGIALVVSLFAKEVLQLFTTESYIAAYRVVPYLAFGLVAYGAYYIVSIGSNLARKTEYITFSTLFAAIINIMLNMVLIPIPGMVKMRMANHWPMAFIFTKSPPGVSLGDRN